MIRSFITVVLLLMCKPLFCWGFFGHRLINEYAVYLLPPEMLVLYKKNIGYLRDHATDADKRRYIVAGEAPRHYIDLDRYGKPPYSELPRRWKDAVARYGEDSLLAHGIVPWRVMEMIAALTKAFGEKDLAKVLRLSADLGHYIGDAHVPLHTSSNHNGQLTNQHGIHAFWESRIPELLAEKEWDFFMEKAEYIGKPAAFIWSVVLESAVAADTVLHVEKQLSAATPPDLKYAYEWRNQQVIRQYAAGYCIRYNRLLNGMIERRLRQAVHATASCWYTAWIDAGQPDLSTLHGQVPIGQQSALDSLNWLWRLRPVNVPLCD